MSDSQSGPRKRLLAAVVLSSVLTSAVFGFAAGLLAGNDALRGKTMALLGSKPSADATADVAPQVLGETDTVPAPVALSDEQRRINVVEKVSPAVVSIVISKDMPTYEQYYANPFGEGGTGNPLFDQFFGSRFQVPQYRQNGTEKREIGAGTGFLVSADGYIVTNRHVAADETAEYTVIFQDGEKFIGKVLARDSVNDIAVLKIEKKDGKDFTFIEYGDSANLKVGQSVVAIGYALGRFGNTVSSGIVSGLQRSISAGDGRSTSEDLYDVIQTDTAINPGNSGGPLLDLNGKVIGVNVAIVQGSQNIGFSLPINDVRRAVESVQKTGKITRAFLGVRYQVIDKALQEKNQLSVDYGMLVARGVDASELAVMPGSPADLAGIVENDIILEAEGKKLTAELPLAAVLSKYGAGDTVKLKVLHKGSEKLVSVTLGERK